MTVTVLPWPARRWRTWRSVNHTGGVEAGGGFVEEVEGTAGLAAREFGGELDALGLASGEGGALRHAPDIILLDQINPQTLAQGGGGPLQGVQGDGGIAWIEEAVERRAAGVHAPRHFGFRQALGVANRLVH